MLVTSCDAYRDVERPFAALFRKYWPDCPFELVLLSETESGTPGFDRAICTGEGLNWSQMLVRALGEIDSPYVLMLMNDYFLVSPVDAERMSRRLEEAVARKALNLRLNPNPPPPGISNASHDSPALPFPKNCAYAVSCQAGFWERGFLRDLAAKTKSAWEFERRGSFMFDETDTRPLLVTPTKEFPFVDAVHKGYWEPWGIAALKDNAIDYDFSARGLPPFSVRFKEAVKRFVWKLGPDAVTRLQNVFDVGMKEKKRRSGST